MSALINGSLDTVLAAVALVLRVRLCESDWNGTVRGAWRNVLCALVMSARGGSEEARRRSRVAEGAAGTKRRGAH